MIDIMNVYGLMLLMGVASETVAFAQASLPAVNGSFWGVPLQSTVQYGATSFKAAYYASDFNYFVWVDSSSPLTDVFEPTSWNSRSTGTKWLARIPFPQDFVLPDVTATDTPNNPLTVYEASTGRVWRLNGAVRPNAGGAVYAYMGDATHGGSGLSGGEVTDGELNQGRIPHALAVNVWAKSYLSFAGGTGYVAPALRADSYASAQTYGGTNPLIKMGSKLAIPRSVTASALGLRSAEAQTVLKALQEYGAYIVDDTAWDAFAINADAAAGTRLNGLSSEMLALYSALNVVTGESSSAPAPSAPAAPSNVVASLQNGTQVTLRWQDNSSNETGFQIWVTSDGRNWTSLASLDANVKSYSYSPRPPSSVKYTYRICAVNEVGASALTLSNALAIKVRR